MKTKKMNRRLEDDQRLDQERKDVAGDREQDMTCDKQAD